MKGLIYLLVIGLVLVSLVSASCSSSSTPSTEVTTIVVATYAHWPPFESINEHTQEIEGLDIDIMNAIAARQNLAVEFKDVAWDPLLAGMAQGMYDAAISSITITDERKKDMLFSDPYFAAGQLVVVQKNNGTITGKDTLTGLVGVLSDTTGYIEVQKIKAATVKAYDAIGPAFQDLINGQINAVVCDNPVALLYVARNADKLKTVGKIFTDEKYGIAVNKKEPELLAKIDAGLKAIKDEGLIDQYSQKWLK
jgi:polar amino acid transport system substrate-binding protein